MQRDGIVVGAINTINPLYHLAVLGADIKIAADKGDWKGVGGALTKAGVAVVGMIVGAKAAPKASGIAKVAGGGRYREVFFAAYPKLRGKVIVHHSIEQQVLKRFPGLFTEGEIHSLGNLRGIPKSVNAELHLSRIRRAWNEFYRENPNPTRQRVLDYATEIDKRFGSDFEPPR